MERTCVLLTLAQKREIIKHKQTHPKLSNKEVGAWASEKFKVRVTNSTICRTLKNSMRILQQNTRGGVKRTRIPHLPEVEAILYEWFLGAHEKHVPISDDLLCEKGK